MSNALTRASQVLKSTAGYRWYAEKSRNDQRVLKLLSLLTLGLGFVLGIWQPVSDFEARQRARASASQGLFEWITLNRNELTRASRQSTDGGAASTSGPTIADITNSAAEFNIVLSRLQPEADGTVSISVEQQSFDGLIAWIAALEQKQQYVVERGSIDRSVEVGLVNAQFRFR
jgi:type II secretory pathway component PulM